MCDSYLIHRLHSRYTEKTGIDTRLSNTLSVFFFFSKPKNHGCVKCGMQANNDQWSLDQKGVLVGRLLSSGVRLRTNCFLQKFVCWQFCLFEDHPLKFMATSWTRTNDDSWRHMYFSKDSRGPRVSRNNVYGGFDLFFFNFILHCEMSVQNLIDLLYDVKGVPFINLL